MTAARGRLLMLSLLVGAAAAHAQHAGNHAPAAAVPDPGAGVPMAVEPADRGAAFPRTDGHTVHDRVVRTFVLLDQLEWQDAASGAAAAWEARAWIGRDVDRVWLRSDGQYGEADVKSASLDVLWGHAFARWWELVIGVRQEFEPDPERTWVAAGVQGLAPLWFEIEATTYIGEGGRLAAHFEVDYDLLLTNRLILEPRLDAVLHSEDDRARRIGSGLSRVEAGLRLRYEIRRDLAPYIGFVWQRAVGHTADFVRDAGGEADDLRLVAGLRFWF